MTFLTLLLLPPLIWILIILDRIANALGRIADILAPDDVKTASPLLCLFDIVSTLNNR